MSDQLGENDPIIERASRLLGAAERFDDDFEQSLIAAIRADRPLRPIALRRASPLTPAWWAASGGLRLSPISGLALAAGIAAIAVLGTLGLTRRAAGRPAILTASIHDTVTFVRFVFVGPAKSVALVGDFNGWGGRQTSLTQTPNGAWTVSVPMTNGRHEYAFVVDGTRWVPDPLALTSSDDFDTKSSIISVGS